MFRRFIVFQSPCGEFVYWNSNSPSVQSIQPTFQSPCGEFVYWNEKAAKEIELLLEVSIPLRGICLLKLLEAEALAERDFWRAIWRLPSSYPISAIWLRLTFAIAKPKSIELSRFWSFDGTPRVFDRAWSRQNLHLMEMIIRLSHSVETLRNRRQASALSWAIASPISNPLSLPYLQNREYVPESGHRQPHHHQPL